MYAIELLKKEAPRPAIKGGRKQQQSIETNNNSSSNLVNDIKKTKELKNSENSDAVLNSAPAKLPRSTSIAIENESSKTDSSVSNYSSRNRIREDSTRSSSWRTEKTDIPAETPSRSVPLKTEKVDTIETSNRSSSLKTEKNENDSAASRISSWREKRATENNTDVKSTTENNTDKKSTPLSRYQRDEVPSRIRTNEKVSYAFGLIIHFKIIIKTEFKLLFS